MILGKLCYVAGHAKFPDVSEGYIVGPLGDILAIAIDELSILLVPYPSH
jgi:hypothetical protein